MGETNFEMSLSFDSTEDDGSPRVFAGMYRMPFADLHHSVPVGSIVYTSAGSITTVDALRAAWLAGEFDRPLYRPAGSSESVQDATQP